MKGHWTRIKRFGVGASDKFSRFVGSWTFVFLYTAAMIAWIALHWSGVLHIDSSDFIKWNLWLSYFAGTQASIVLMSNCREASKESKKHDISLKMDKETLILTKRNNKKIQKLCQKISMLEDMVDGFLKESK